MCMHNKLPLWYGVRSISIGIMSGLRTRRHRIASRQMRIRWNGLRLHYCALQFIFQKRNYSVNLIMRIHNFVLTHLHFAVPPNSMKRNPCWIADSPSGVRERPNLLGN